MRKLQRIELYFPWFKNYLNCSSYAKIMIVLLSTAQQEKTKLNINGAELTAI